MSAPAAIAFEDGQITRMNGLRMEVGMAGRTFHVEITFRKTVAVNVAPGDIPEDEDEQDWVIEEALLTCSDSECVVDEDYEIETVKEVAEKSA